MPELFCGHTWSNANKNSQQKGCVATQLEISSRTEFAVVEYCGAGKVKWNSEQNQHVRVSSSETKITISVIFILKFKEIFNKKNIFKWCTKTNKNYNHC